MGGAALGRHRAHVAAGPHGHLQDGALDVGDRLLRHHHVVVAGLGLGSGLELGLG